MATKVRVFGAIPAWSWKTSISNFTTTQTMKFDRNQGVWLRYWKETFEQIIG